MKTTCIHLNAKALLLSAVLAIGSPAVMAGPLVSNWGFTIDAAFNTGNTFYTAGSGTKSTTAQMLSWGSGSGNSNPLSNNDRSGLLIGKDPSAGTIVTNSLSAAPTLTVTHVNNSISGDYATLLSTVIDSTLTLTPNVLPGGSATVPFGIKFSETSNNNNCVVTGGSNCDDIFVLTSGLLNFPFDYDGNSYYLNILNITGGTLTALTPLDPLVCAAAGEAAGCRGFTTREGQATTIQFGLTITGQPLSVPEPSILALLGVSLIGMRIMRRRKI